MATPRSISYAFLLCFIIQTVFISLSSAYNVSSDGRAIIIDSRRRVLLSGSIHYPRSTPEMWPDLIRKAKAGGLDAIETYVFWNAHEPSRRQYDFSGNLDLIRFIKTIQDEGLYAVLRIGPYVCAEWNYGGFPVWLHNMPGVQELRTVNEVFMNEMQNFTALMVDMVKQEKLFASQGGPIILAQIENEYGNMISNYGEAVKLYIDWCAKMADSLDIGVPWIMCQESDAPQPMINTCNGWYCDSFTPNNPNSPKMWTENWTGWFKSWGGKDPPRTAEDLAFSVARFFQTGGTFQNYYMYHGGTNFGRTSGGPYLTTTYDYDAPLDEFGNLNQPKWGHLKELHNVLKAMEKTLTHGNVSTTDFGNSVTATVYATEEGSSCFFGNANTTGDAAITFQGSDYVVPAWSASILPDCKTEVYSTAKVNAQTSLIVKKPNQAENEPSSLKWVWRPEVIDEPVVQGKGSFAASSLIDQKPDDIIWGDNMTLRVNTSGIVLHAYVNGEHIGSQWTKYGVFKDVFEQQIKLNPGKNQISLLSVTVGLQNYGPMFDMVQTGITGPVELIGRKGDESVIKDLSSHKWSYKVGLSGLEEQKFYSTVNTNNETSGWFADNVPTNSRMTWYKTTFKAPLGNDAVVLDLQGMGKGFAWVNGHKIGRHWPSYLAEEDGCSSDACDYRGQYDNNKCVTNCGQPSQRWYHVPRSFLQDDVNTLVLFEEFGGNPSQVNFQTLVVGTACGNAYEEKTLELSCNGRPISAIKFASFGDPQGTCGSFEVGTCEAEKEILPILQQECVGKETCYIDISEDKLCKTSCGSIVKRLAVEAVC
ncbi:hypothetical protein Pint_13540 [Pistacia integerrima]|uniref:Uncharacterized protein n=1 Tax=Pistacia integerrima TaxID=434235 RepID=A0ACC0Y840_9ROSI|nr:hypothetical protein Pint_13540 [Pistacia integerrima]